MGIVLSQATRLLHINKVLNYLINCVAASFRCELVALVLQEKLPVVATKHNRGWVGGGKLETLRTGGGQEFRISSM